MQINLIEPIIGPEKNIYTTIGSSISIPVGILTNNNNFEIPTVNREWKLYDVDITVSSGYVDAELNSFDVSIDLIDLLPNKLYLLEIKNAAKNTVAIISTFSVLPTIINELTPITEPFIVMGYLNVIGDMQTASPTNPCYVKLPLNWDIYSKESTALIKTNSGSLFAFAPTRILTHSTLPFSSIDFSAYPSIPNISIPVNTLPRIRKIAPFKFSVVPETRLSIKIFFSDLTNNTVDTIIKKSEINIDPSNQIVAYIFDPIYS